MQKLLILCLLLAITNIVHAQKPPIKWGKIDEADLAMSSYPDDPDADAVVLMDYASINFKFQGNTSYLMDHHVRIKILKESAFDRGDIEIDYYSHQKIEKITGLKAQIILPNGEKISLKNKDIFTEEITENWSRKKFAMPALKVGAIIEYKYTKESEATYNLVDWYFQRDIPTRHSELRTNIPEWFDYIAFTQGAAPTITTDVTTENINYRDTQTADRSSGGRAAAKMLKKSYIMTDVPGLKPERFITTMRDYYAKINLQLQSVQFPGGLLQPVNNSWEEVADNLNTSGSFGEQLSKKRHTKKIMEAITPYLDSATDPMEKLMIIYNYLNSTIEWNERYGIYVRESLDDAFEDKLATAGELNMMLIAACKQIGIETYPVLISTRNHGKMLQHYPKTDQFNHVIAFAKAGQNELLLDVGSEHRSPALLRVSSLNYIGWLVDGPNSQWINVGVPADSETMMVTAELSADGKLTGSVQQVSSGYSAMESRNDYYLNKDKDLEHIKKDWQETYPDAKVENIVFDNPEKAAESLKSSFEIELPDVAQINGDFIYLSPMLGTGYEENPLKLEERAFPVDIPFQIKEQYIFNLTVPEGYVIEEMPETAQVAMENNAGFFKFLVSQNEGEIQITSKIYIKKIRYKPEAYQIIRQFYDLIVEKHGEQIVLKKTT